MNEVYVVAGRRRTLHRAARLEGGLATKEGCNLDQAKPREIYTELAVAERNAKRTCARCFSKEVPMTDNENEQTAEPEGRAGIRSTKEVDGLRWTVADDDEAAIDDGSEDKEGVGDADHDPEGDKG